jgi:L-cysteine:1D-myo-inositol 2-amino-2-deoxy-alpha-D-glucopyranoside ligase
MTQEAGAPATPVLAGLRERLADDLDSPAAIALVDAWAADTLGGDGPVEDDAPRIVRDAVDALLGVTVDWGVQDRQAQG